MSIPDNFEYAELTDRIKAVFADMIVLVVMIYAVTAIFSSFEEVPTYARVMAFIGIFILYDPLFTSLFGGTIGHLSNGLKVKRQSNPKRNVIFPLAIIRFVVKSFLGVISLLTVTSSFENKAIHDSLVGSIVIKRKGSS